MMLSAVILAFKMETGVRDAGGMQPAGLVTAPRFIARVQRRGMSMAVQSENCPHHDDLPQHPGKGMWAQSGTSHARLAFLWARLCLGGP